MSLADVYSQLLDERYGPVPYAEHNRPLRRQHGSGGPDTPQAIAARRRDLYEALKGAPGRNTAKEET